jgi:hypothetical protein
VLPEVDDVWHLSYLQSTGGGASAMRIHAMGLSLNAYKHVENAQPACVVLHACPLEAPPRPSADYSGRRRDDTRPTLPEPAVAVAHCAELHGGGGSGPSLSDATKRVLLLAAESRGGRCRKLILGPHSGPPLMEAFMMEYAIAHDDSRADLVTFIEDVLGVQNHRMEGWAQCGRHPNSWTVEFHSLTAAEYQEAQAAGKSIWEM